jgi:iron complex transport system permease protein
VFRPIRTTPAVSGAAGTTARPQPTGPSTRRRSPHRRWTGLALCAVGLLTACLLSLAIGTEPVSPSVVWSALTDYTDRGDQWIVHDLRVPRTVLGLVVGVALGMSGALIQAVGRNPLADTQILGINSGAGLFVVAAISFFGLQSLWAYVWFAFAGALAAMLVVFLVATLGGTSITPIQLLLSGVALGALMDGVSFTIRLHDPRAFDSMRFWDAGALDERPMSVALTVAPFVLAGLVLALVVSASLNVLALGDELATAMGSRVRRTQLCALAAVTLLAGAATAAAGPIGFVGLMVPHAVRRLAGPDWRWIFAYTLFAAPTLLLSADVLGRVVIPPGELPAGIVTAFVGAPVLIWLIRRDTADDR